MMVNTIYMFTNQIYIVLWSRCYSFCLISDIIAETRIIYTYNVGFLFLCWYNLEILGIGFKLKMSCAFAIASTIHNNNALTITYKK